MERFELIFRFDNEDNSLSRFNGLTIENLAKFLKALGNAVASGKEDKMVLSEIKGNCYAPVLTTNSITQYESVKILHSEIAKKNFYGLNSNQKSYYDTLSSIMKNELVLSVYDRSKAFYKTIEKLEPLVSFPHFYETNALKGYLTRIGSRNLRSRNTIFISSYSNEIEISEEQDKELRQYYKKGLLEFYVTEKTNKDTSKAESIVLDGFIVLATDKSTSFLNAISNVRDKHGKFFSNALNDCDAE